MFRRGLGLGDLPGYSAQRDDNGSSRGQENAFQSSEAGIDAAVAFRADRLVRGQLAADFVCCGHGVLIAKVLPAPPDILIHVVKAPTCFGLE